VALVLASRAARQSGDLGAAAGRLRDCHRRDGQPTDEVAFEWALLQAAGGNVTEVEEYLYRQLDQDPAVAPLVWEALTEGYLRVYRTPDAMACLTAWLDRDPGNVRALELRGTTFVTGKGVQQGSLDLRRALEIDPTRTATRWRLVRALLALGSYQEAVTHLEWLARDHPDDPEVLVGLARCRLMLGQRDQAVQALDAVLAKDPDHGLGLRTRGQVAISEQRPAEAEGWLRRAAQVLPQNYQAQWLLFQSLQQQGKTAEAEAQLRVAERVRDQSERLSELQSRKLAEHPLDPALNYEMGMLLMRAGNAAVAEQWLKNAVSLDPGYRPAHAALADHYARTGRTAEAEAHRKLAAE
jgi:predicted Zn-dependent protease